MFNKSTEEFRIMKKALFYLLSALVTAFAFVKIMNNKKSTNMTKNINKTKEKNSMIQNMDNNTLIFEMKYELYKQLHEQFAINDNNKTQIVISFLAAIFAVFTGYGVCLYGNKQEILIYVTIAAQALLLLLSILCLYFGYSTRRDNFVIYNIRCKFHLSEELPYSDPYSDERKKWWMILPDYYAIMYVSCLVFLIAITIVSIIINKEWKCFNLYTFLLADGISIFLICVYFILFYRSKYLRFFDEAKEKKEQILLNTECNS